jgi:hypothetical protein
MNTIFLISTGSASPQDAPVYVGVGLVAMGLLALWYRDQSYIACQLIRSYPDHGPIYVVIQLVVPALAVVGGVALVASRFVGS